MSDTDESLEEEALAPHPLGVRPEGNALIASGEHQPRATGLGTLGRLTDARVIEILRLMDSAALGAIGECHRPAGDAFVRPNRSRIASDILSSLSAACTLCTQRMGLSEMVGGSAQ